jgi:hypothetical protein
MLIDGIVVNFDVVQETLETRDRERSLSFVLLGVVVLVTRLKAR